MISKKKAEDIASGILRTLSLKKEGVTGRGKMFVS